MIDTDPFGARQDVSILASTCGALLIHYMYGCLDPEWEQAERSGKINELLYSYFVFFTPTIQRTMRTGVDAFALAAKSFFEKLA